MSWLVIATAACAIIDLQFAALSFGFSRAAGWRRFRWFAAAAAAGGLFSAVNSVFVLPRVSDAAVLLAGRLNLCLGALFAIAWLLHAKERWGSWSLPGGKWFLVALAGAAGAALIPGAVVDGPAIRLSLPGLGVTYRTPETTILGGVVLLVLIVALSGPLVQLLRTTDDRPGPTNRRIELAGYAVFYASTVNDMLAATGVWRSPYLLDFGFIALVASVGIAMIQRVKEDAEALQRMNARLEDQVRRRSHELLSTQQALLHAERHAALGTLAAGVGHEIKNPLAYILCNAEFALAEISARPGLEKVSAALADVVDGVGRIRRVVDDLAVFGRGADQGEASCDVDRTVEDALRVAAPQVRHSAVLETRLGDPPPAAIESGRLCQVVVNLLINAAHAIDARAQRSAEASIVVCTRRGDDGGSVVEVRDTGIGISKEAIDHIFEPYFTSKEVAHGSGLGLFVCKGIVDTAGGSLQVDSTAGSGTVVTVRLPPAPSVEKPSEAIEPAHRAAAAVAGLRVLVIDDEPAVTRSIARLLEVAEVRCANCALDARKMLDSTSFDVVLCDVMMPDERGDELYDALAAESPDLAERFIFISGGAVTSGARAFVAREEIRWLAKPIDRSQLLGTVAEVASRAGTVSAGSAQCETAGTAG